MWNILFLEFHRKKKSRWIKKKTEQQNKWNSSDLLMYKILKSQFGLSSGWMKHIKQSSSFCRIKCERKTVTRPDAWGSLTVFIQLSCHRILYIVIKKVLKIIGKTYSLFCGWRYFSLLCLWARKVQSSLPVSVLNRYNAKIRI